MPLKILNRIFFDADGGEGTGGGDGTATAPAPAPAPAVTPPAVTPPAVTPPTPSSGPPDGLLTSAGNDTPPGDGQGVTPPPVGDAQVPQGDIPNRPDNVSEQFWDVTTGKLKGDTLANSYNDLRKQFNQLVQDKGVAPEDFEAYLEDFKPPVRGRAGEGQTEGDVMDRYGQLEAGDPIFQVLAKAAKGADMKEGKFKDFVQDVMEGLHPLLPERMDPAKEREILGENAEGVITTNRDWADTLFRNGIVNEAEFNQLLTLGKNAIGIQLMNKLRMNSGEKTIPIKLNGGQGSGVKTPDECQALMGVKVEGGGLLKDEDTPAGAAHRVLIETEFAKTYGTDEES